MIKKGALFAALALLLCCTKPPEDLVSYNSAKEYQKIQTEQKKAFDHPLSLDDVISLVLERNLDYMSKRRERELQDDKVIASKLGMLPSLTASASVSERDRLSLSSSLTPSISRVSDPSVGSKRTSRDYEVSVAWNYLDFGLSYFNYKTAQRQGIIAEQELARLRQNLILTAVTTYWKLIVAKYAVDSTNDVLLSIEEQAKKWRAGAKSKNIAPEQWLVKEKDLLDIRIDLHNFQAAYKSEKEELAKLLALPPGADFDVVSSIALKPLHNDFNIESLEKRALQERPELAKYIQEIGVQYDKTRASLLEMAPGIKFFRSATYDPNIYLTYNQWWNTGITAAWDLMSLPKKMSSYEIQKKSLEFLEEAKLTISLGIVSQVRLAYIDYHESTQRHALLKKRAKVLDDLLQSVINTKKAGKTSGSDLLKAQVDQLFASIRELEAYSEVFVNLARLENSVGTITNAPIGSSIKEYEIAQLPPPTATPATLSPPQQVKAKKSPLKELEDQTPRGLPPKPQGPQKNRIY